MKFFVGIVPPADIYGHIQGIQQQFGDNRLEPHITIRPPVLPVSQAEWLSVIKQVATLTKPFNVHLTGTGSFGSRVLFLSVESEQLHHLHRQLLPELKLFEPLVPAKQPERFHPHLTLGRAWCGFTPDDFRGMKKLADEYLQAGVVSFEVSHVRIYHKPEHQGRFTTYQDVPLNGQSSS